MTFGLEFNSSTNRTVISSILNHYVCVESKTTTVGVPKPTGGDIITYTSLSGASCLHNIPGNPGYINFDGSLHRVCVFRESSRVPAINGGMGVQITGEHGDVSTLTDVYFMELYKNGSGYASIALAPYNYTEPERLPPVFISISRGVTNLGRVFTQRVERPSYGGPTGLSVSCNNQPLIVDVSKIPLNYLHPNIVSILT